MATYLTLINNVLRELRETQLSVSATSITAGSYAELIGQFINQAKEEVEAAWNWKALRSDIPFSTVGGTKDYALTGTDERSRLLYDDQRRPLVYNLTSRTQLVECPLAYTTTFIASAAPQTTTPFYFSQIRSTTGISLRIYPAPNAVYSMQASVYVPQAALSATSDVLVVPSRPVWYRALAYAFAERGDGMGQRADVAMHSANKYLADYIATDAEDGELTVYQA